jgi:hypothetical protein
MNHIISMNKDLFITIKFNFFNRFFRSMSSNRDLYSNKDIGGINISLSTEHFLKDVFFNT